MSLDTDSFVVYGIDMRKYETVTETLQRMIHESGKTLTEIGKAVGVDHGRLSRFLSGDRSLTLPAVDRLAKYFGLKLTKARKLHD